MVVDTDVGRAVTFRSAVGEGRANMSGDPDDIVVEMTNFDKDDEESKRPSDNQARLRSKIGAKMSLSSNGSRGLNRGASGGSNKADDFNNINHYVIDDDEDEDDEDDEDEKGKADEHEAENEATSESNIECFVKGRTRLFGSTDVGSNSDLHTDVSADDRSDGSKDEGDGRVGLVRDRLGDEEDNDRE